MATTDIDTATENGARAPTDWEAITRRNARSVQTTVGWIFSDPGAIARYRAEGLPAAMAGPLGYLAARCAPLAGAGPQAVIAAFGSISPLGIRALFEMVQPAGRFLRFWRTRDEAVAEGLVKFAPDIVEPLVELGPKLWDVVDRLTTLPWELLGEALAVEFAERFEPPCASLLKRVDDTAGTKYQPASRVR
jgi:hypothetical protein